MSTHAVDALHRHIATLESNRPGCISTQTTGELKFLGVTGVGYFLNVGRIRSVLRQDMAVVAMILDCVQSADDNDDTMITFAVLQYYNILSI